MDYGLKISFLADWSDDGIEGQYQLDIADPSLDRLTEAYLQLIEATFQWGISRAELAAKVCAIMDNIIDEDIQTILDRAQIDEV